MQAFYDANASKKSSNPSINSSLLSKTRALKIDLSATLEAALLELIRQRERECWLIENQQAICNYNNFVDENGVFSDGLRGF